MAKQKAGIKECMATIPIDTGEFPTFRLHIDIGVNGEQAMAIRRVASALDKSNETLKNGRRCVNINDAMRWILEQIK